jgi:hypothetical protein
MRPQTETLGPGRAFAGLALGLEAPDLLAEDRGFEPLRVLTQHDFQSCALGH